MAGGEELTVANERLTAFAKRDERPGLPNSRFCADVEGLSQTARRGDAAWFSFIADFDNFKTINTKVTPAWQTPFCVNRKPFAKMRARYGYGIKIMSDRFDLLSLGLTIAILL